MESTRTPRLTTATVIVVFCDGKGVADLMAECDVRLVPTPMGNARYITADGPIDFVATVMDESDGTATLLVTYVTDLYDHPTEWIGEGVREGCNFHGIVRSVIGFGR